MKVLFLTRRFWPSIGGVETHVGEVTEILLREDYQITIIKEEDKKSYRNSYQSINSSARSLGKEKIPKIYEIPSLRDNWIKKFSIWKWLLENRSIIKDVDIVHCHDVFFWYLPFRFLYPSKPVFTTFHGYETKFPPAKKAIIMRKISEKLSWGNICVGDFIRRWYGTKPDVVTYGGTSFLQQNTFPKNKILKFSQKFSQKNSGEVTWRQKTRKKKIRIIFVGRLEEDTGVPYYLKGLKELKKMGVYFKFEAFGEGGLKSKVKEWGKVYKYENNLYSKINSAQISFSSSYLSILNLLSTKNLVLSVFTNPLKRDYLVNSPFSKYIYIVSTPNLLVKKIREILQNPKKYDSIVEKGYEFANAQTWESVAKKYKNLWKKTR